MKNIIPGHVRAVTWILTLVLALVTYAVTRSAESVVGSIVLATGFFLADQATHLAQEDHAAKPPTWIERMQQKYRITSVLLGTILVGIGGAMMVYFWG